MKGIPKFILLSLLFFSFLSLLYPALCNPIIFKLSNSIIGEPDEPPSVPTLYTKKSSFLSIIFPIENFKFLPPGYCIINICSSI